MPPGAVRPQVAHARERRSTCDAPIPTPLRSGDERWRYGAEVEANALAQRMYQPELATRSRRSWRPSASRAQSIRTHDFDAPLPPRPNGAMPASRGAPRARGPGPTAGRRFVGRLMVVLFDPGEFPSILLYSPLQVVWSSRSRARSNKLLVARLAAGTASGPGMMSAEPP